MTRSGRPGSAGSFTYEQVPRDIEPQRGSGGRDGFEAEFYAGSGAPLLDFETRGGTPEPGSARSEISERIARAETDRLVPSVVSFFGMSEWKLLLRLCSSRYLFLFVMFYL